MLPRVEAATAMVNKRLKVVAARAGIEKVMTTHTAWHSFADRGRRLGLPAAHIRDMLNHHSISQTEEYFAELECSELSQKAVGIYTRVLPAVKPAQNKADDWCQRQLVKSAWKLFKTIMTRGR